MIAARFILASTAPTAHMIGAEVTELIQGYTTAKTLETTEAELMETVFRIRR